jgi:drug/metabolite transporter (DMT)-like permease
LIALCGVGPLVFVVPVVRAALGQTLLLAVSWLLSGLMVVYYLAGAMAFASAPVADIMLLINTTPLFVIGFNVASGRGISRAELGGACLAFSGVAAIVAPNINVEGVVSSQTLYGDACALLCAVIRGAYALIYRQAEQHGAAPDVTVVSVMTFAGGALLLPLRGSSVPSVASDWLTLILLGIVATAVPTCMNAIASRRLPPTLTATSGLLTPVVATLLAAAVLSEVPSIWVTAGAGLVLLGLAVLTLKPAQHADA